MAKEINEKKIDELLTKTSTSVYGMTDDLDQESQRIRSIIKLTSAQTNDIYGSRVNGKPIDYVREMNFNSLFAATNNPGKKKDKEKTSQNSVQDLKKFMNETESGAATSILYSDTNYIMQIQNYKAIKENIPECGTCLDIIKDNILSPDDYTKMLFEIKYDTTNQNEKNTVLNNIENLKKKYHFEEKVDEILDNALVTGICPVAVLSLEEEFSSMLNDSRTLNECYNSARENDLRTHDIAVSVHDISDLTTLERNALLESYSVESDNENITDSEKIKIISESIVSTANTHIKIGSSKELLVDRIMAEKSNYNRLTEEKAYDFEGLYGNKDKKKLNKKDDNKPLGLTVSVIRILDPEKFVDLTIDDINYGGLYIETPTTGIYNGENTYLGTPINSPSTNTSMMTPQGVGQPGVRNAPQSQTSSSAQILNVTDQKLRLISDVFLRTLTKKIDKDFIRNNKQLKDVLYSLVKQNYIINKDIKVTYFTPEELVIFRVPPIYRKIIFFAKLYLATLTNTLLVKLGRGHDKRVFYISGGLDNNLEQAVSTVIQDVKTKEYKLSTINSISTILQLNPGHFDDYFFPEINGERPIQIETLAGMDIDINNDFIQYLKNSMLSGMNVPSTLIDEMQNLEYARKLASQNANFMRFILRYQMLLTQPFDRMIKQLYNNEYLIASSTNEDGKKIQTEFSENGNINNISVSFPSPANLNQSNLTDQIQTAETNAQFVVDSLLPSKQDMSNENDRIALKAAVVKEMVPGIDWNKYEKLLEKIKKSQNKEKIKEKYKTEREMNNSEFNGGSEY